VTGMKRIGEKFKEYDSDNLVLVTVVGEQPLGQDAHQYYDDLVKKLRPPTSRSTCAVTRAVPSATSRLPRFARLWRTRSRRRG